MCSITLPTIRRFAERVGADFKIISERKFPSFPVNYERLQIYELGRDYDWNINIDADIVIGDELVDPCERLTESHVGLVMLFDLDDYIDTTGNKYFQRDGRKIGIVDTLVVTSRLTHDLWEPLTGEFESYTPFFRDGVTRRISEYCLSQNVAKYGLRYSGLYKTGEPIFHIDYTSSNKDDCAELALDKLREWGCKTTT
jgi:hypothetical protein